MILLKKSTKRFLLTSAALVLGLYILLQSNYVDIPSDFMVKYGSKATPAAVARARAHYMEIFELIRKAHPLIDGKEFNLNENYKDESRPGVRAFSDKYPLGTKEELRQYLQLSDEELKILRDSHSLLVDGLPKKAPSGLYSGAGVVTTTGKKHIPIFMATLRMLRKTSPDIPVEVFMVNEDEYEPEICEKVLPALNARCVLFTDVYGQQLLDDFDIQGYQYKAMAMLASTFEDVIFIDSDSIPVRDLETIFKKDVWTKTGFISWPDYWYRTTSPFYYDIASVELGKRVRGDLTITNPDEIPMADLDGAVPDRSTESGQMYFSKSKHYRGLLLALYYNIYDSIYYPLFSQGVHGEGDKETFRSAVVIMNDNPSFQVSTEIFPYGHTRPIDDAFKGVALPQADPDQDYRKYVLGQHADKIPTTMFVHMNAFKLDPKMLFIHDEVKDFFLTDDDSNRVRILGKPLHMDGRNPLENDDIELEMWKEVEWFICNVTVDQNIVIQHYKDVQDKLPEYCEITKRYVDFLEKTTLKDKDKKNPADYNW